MNKTVFVDTSGFYALLAQQDDQHEKANDILRRSSIDKRTFVTTDYVLDEAATLLLARGLDHIVESMFEAVLQSKACKVVWMDAELFYRTKVFFLKHKDHPWSFTDCSSFLVMKDLGLHEALTKDKHFIQAGFKALLI